MDVKKYRRIGNGTLGEKGRERGAEKRTLGNWKAALARERRIPEWSLSTRAWLASCLFPCGLSCDPC